MNYHSDEIPASPDPAFEDVELRELADEMRTVWHAIASGLHHTGRLEGLQRQQMWLLSALEHGPRRMSALAECTGTSQASLTGVVDRLEERGLVERVRPQGDRRVVEVALTEVGRAESTAARQRMLARIDAVLSPLGPADRAELLRLMRTIAQANRPTRCDR